MMMNTSAVFSPQSLRETLARSGPDAVALRLLTRRPGEVVDALCFLPPGERQSVFLALPTPAAAQALARCPASMTERLLAGLSARLIAERLDWLPADEAANLCERMSPPLREAVLQEMAPGLVLEVQELLRRPANTVARQMYRAVPRADGSESVAEALARLREGAVDPRSIGLLCVVDAEDRLRGVVTLERLLLSSGTRRLSRLAVPPVQVLSLDALVRTAVDAMAAYRLRALPVTDADGHLLGTLTLEKALRSGRLRPDSAEAPDPATGGRPGSRRTLIAFAQRLFHQRRAASTPPGQDGGSDRVDELARRLDSAQRRLTELERRSSRGRWDLAGKLAAALRKLRGLWARRSSSTDED